MTMINPQSETDAASFNGFKDIIHDYVDRERFLQTVTGKVLEGIEAIAGADCAEAVREAGLDKVHEHFSPDFLPFLNRFLQKNLTEHVIRETAEVGRHTLGIGADFFIDGNVVYRLYYPHDVARRSCLKRPLYLSLNLDNWTNAAEELAQAAARQAENPSKASDGPGYDYHRGLPDPAYAHGPHRDTWFGHTFGALNLWWSICAVTEQTGVILFEDENGRDLDHIPQPAYLAPGQPISNPQPLSLPDGDLLVFDPEILHATRLNTSNRTRFVVTSRLNVREPVFYQGTSSAEYPYWHRAEDVLASDFGSIVEYWRRDHSVPKPESRLGPARPPRTTIEVDVAFKPGIDVAPFLEGSPIETEPVRLIFPNMSIVVRKVGSAYYAFPSKCPHVGVDLIDGYYDGETVYCAGHGVPFNMKTGQSDCGYLSLAVFKVTVDGARLLIEPR